MSSHRAPGPEVPSAEVRAVIALFRSLGEGLSATVPVADQRAAYEQLALLRPIPPAIGVSEELIGGVPCEWVEAPGCQPGRVVLYLHGGGYAIGSLSTHRDVASRLSAASSARVLTVGYRLAPESPFPAAVDDALSVYRETVKRLPGEDGRARVALSGDSAGGGLAVALELALRDAGLPLPAAVACFSPWVDLTQSGESMASKAVEDPILTREGLDHMAALYLGNSGDRREPLASPLFADLAGLAPLLVQCGTSEVLLDDSRRLVETARRAGVVADLEEWEACIHTFHHLAPDAPESMEAMEHAGAFLASYLDEGQENAGRGGRRVAAVQPDESQRFKQWHNQAFTHDMNAR